MWNKWSLVVTDSSNKNLSDHIYHVLFCMWQSHLPYIGSNNSKAT
jgi:hypothetical protein